MSSAGLQGFLEPPRPQVASFGQSSEKWRPRVRFGRCANSARTSSWGCDFGRRSVLTSATTRVDFGVGRLRSNIAPQRARFADCLRAWLWQGSRNSMSRAELVGLAQDLETGHGPRHRTGNTSCRPGQSFERRCPSEVLSERAPGVPQAIPLGRLPIERGLGADGASLRPSPYPEPCAPIFGPARPWTVSVFPLGRAARMPMRRRLAPRLRGSRRL